MLGLGDGDVEARPGRFGRDLDAGVIKEGWNPR